MTVSNDAARKQRERRILFAHRLFAFWQIEMFDTVFKEEAAVFCPRLLLGLYSYEQKYAAQYGIVGAPQPPSLGMAGDWMRLSHAGSQRRYVDFAQQAGFLTVDVNQNSKRRLSIKSTPRLKEVVENSLDQMVEDERIFILTLLNRQAMPTADGGVEFTADAKGHAYMATHNTYADELKKAEMAENSRKL